MRHGDDPPREYVVTAFPDPANGPGWSNTPIVAVIQEYGGGPIRLEYIQPKDQTERMRTLYHIGAEVSEALTKDAAVLLGKEYR